ncbi:RHS repeat-associated core domain protein [Niastella koreensis GR20-10]|uniref:RHS repeat-associated core domain protein n=4 Tax=Niastella koreensis TaxID=354356 RepID=G8TAM2_NIAKG|nr:RHS repeat-associated core domain protein [Niastella koreensis GR20-10]
MQGGVMDSLNYYYYANTNRLKFITDNVPASGYDGGPDHNIIDIDGQADNNYVYDDIGNLIADKAENITDIKWNVYGKIDEITRTATASVPATDIKYTYDASGNRISQVVTSGGTKHYTWYVRDAQGNMLSTYTADGNDPDLANLQLNQEEKFLYGSSRLGLITVKESVDGGPDNLQFYYDGRTFSLGRGRKQYELTNHLGNVLATISDKKFGVSSGGSSLISYYEPDIVTAQDYYPFGMISREALPNSGVAYKFGFNGKMNDNDVKGGYGLQQDYGMRIYDGRVGRFLSVDPLTHSYPWYTPYQFAGNSPMANIDLDGGEPKPSTDGTQEGQSQSTSQDFYNLRGDYTQTKQETWYWHAVGLRDAKGNLTKADWYSSEGYVNVLSTSLAAKSLGNELGLYNVAAKSLGGNSELNKQELEKFAGSGLNDAASTHFIAAARATANASNNFVSGKIEPSNFNVEDLLGVGALLKEGIALLGGKIASAAGTEARAALFSLNEGYGVFGKSGLRI